MNDLRYPIGKFEWTIPENEEQMAQRREHSIEVLAKLPSKMRAAVRGLSPEQLDTPYRPEGWSVRQVVHHVPESHMNAYIRFKLALTEDQPTIKAYREDAWAKLPDNPDRGFFATARRAAFPVGRLAGDDEARRFCADPHSS
jgi:Mycothiol maleylpyruvate isomerase N-terminal domain